MHVSPIESIADTGLNTQNEEITLVELHIALHADVRFCSLLKSLHDT